jgi:hypothetical protein
MSAKATAKKSMQETIISAYMTYVLEQETTPKSIYKFCKDNTIEEDEFYSAFGSVAGIQKAIWTVFYRKTIDLIEKNKEYDQFSNKEKMLTFLFSFFELLNLNRSYVLFALKEKGHMLKNLEQLKDLRREIKDFAKELIEDANSEKSNKFSKHNPSLFSEGAWLQFIFLLNFWKEDTSAGFEKTDMAIEKSINTIFDVFENTPLDSIMDFGKFLFKENFA